MTQQAQKALGHRTPEESLQGLLKRAFRRGLQERQVGGHLLDVYSHSSVDVSWLDQRLAAGHRLGWGTTILHFGLLEVLHVED